MQAVHPTFILELPGSRFSPATPSTLVAPSRIEKPANTNFNNNDHNNPNTWLTISLTLLSTLLLILSALVFAFSVVTLTHLSGDLNDVHLTALYLHIFAFCVLMIVSLVGTFYFLPRPEAPPKASRISSLTSSYAAVLLLSVGVSIFCLCLLFQNPPQDGKCALAQAGDAFLAYLCTMSVSLKALMALFLVVLWLVGIAIVVLSSVYAQHIRRREQEEYDSDSSTEVGDDEY